MILQYTLFGALVDHIKIQLVVVFSIMGHKMYNIYAKSSTINLYMQNQIIYAKSSTINLYIEDITWWHEDMNFIFEWQNNILRTSTARE